jgi:hypothetical protein
MPKVFCTQDNLQLATCVQRTGSLCECIPTEGTLGEESQFLSPPRWQPTQLMARNHRHIQATLSPIGSQELWPEETIACLN